jgi:hypothetical protein
LSKLMFSSLLQCGHLCFSCICIPLFGGFIYGKIHSNAALTPLGQAKRRTSQWVER